MDRPVSHPPHGTDTYRFFRIVRIFAVAEAQESQTGIPNTLKSTNSKPVRDATDKKIKTYRPLLNAAAKQYTEHTRPTMPAFHPMIFTHSGEMSSGVFAVLLWITSAYKSQLSKTSRADGLTASQIAAVFRQDFYDQLQSTLVKGFANMLSSAGLPRIIDHGG